MRKKIILTRSHRSKIMKKLLLKLACAVLFVVPALFMSCVSTGGDAVEKLPDREIEKLLDSGVPAQVELEAAKESGLDIAKRKAIDCVKIDGAVVQTRDGYSVAESFLVNRVAFTDEDVKAILNWARENGYTYNTKDTNIISNMDEDYNKYGKSGYGEEEYLSLLPSRFGSKLGYTAESVQMVVCNALSELCGFTTPYFRNENEPIRYLLFGPQSSTFSWMPSWNYYMADGFKLCSGAQYHLIKNALQKGIVQRAGDSELFFVLPLPSTTDSQEN